MKRCAICNGAGFIIKLNETTGEEEGVPCECRLEREEKDVLRMRLIASDIEPRFWEYTFDNYLSLIGSKIKLKHDNSKSIEIFQSLLQDPDKFMKSKDYNVLWIWGTEDYAGHTSLAVIFATELLKRNHTVRFLKSQSLLGAFTNFDTKVEFFNDLNTAQVFVLDNAFDPNRCTIKGEYTIIHLYNWLNDMICADKKIICTSKIPISQIDKQFQQSKNLIMNTGYELEFKGSIPKVKKEFI